MPFYCFTSSIFLLLTSFNLDTSHACSFSCEPDERTCLDNIWGTVTADCSGFLGCLNMTEPCAGTCPPEYPVLSEDGLSCAQCQEEDGEELCPQCKEGEVWCRAEQACQPRAAPCGGQCSLLYPVMTSQTCLPCQEYSRWCREEGKCFDPESEPCGGECHSLGLTFCPGTGTCLQQGVACQDPEDTTNLPQVEEPTKPLSPPIVGPVNPQYYFLIPSFLIVSTSSGFPANPASTGAALPVSRGAALPASTDAAWSIPAIPASTGAAWSIPAIPASTWQLGWVQIPGFNMGINIPAMPLDTEV